MGHARAAMDRRAAKAEAGRPHDGGTELTSGGRSDLAYPRTVRRTQPESKDAGGGRPADNPQGRRPGRVSTARVRIAATGASPERTRTRHGQELPYSHRLPLRAWRNGRLGFFVFAG
jgi:hypothetical protein